MDDPLVRMAKVNSGEISDTEFTWQLWLEQLSYKIFLLEKELGYPVKMLNGIEFVERMKQFDRYTDEYMQEINKSKTKTTT